MSIEKDKIEYELLQVNTLIIMSNGVKIFTPLHINELDLDKATIQGYVLDPKGHAICTSTHIHVEPQHVALMIMDPHNPVSSGYTDKPGYGESIMENFELM